MYSYHLSLYEQGHLDLIVAADVVWLNELVEPLVKALVAFTSGANADAGQAESKRTEGGSLGLGSGFWSLFDKKGGRIGWLQSDLDSCSQLQPPLPLTSAACVTTQRS